MNAISPSILRPNSTKPFDIKKSVTTSMNAAKEKEYQRSLFKIQGNKFDLLPHIDNTLDNMGFCDDTVWVEPFMGSGVVGFNLARKNAFFYDINPHVINFFNDIKNGVITYDIFVTELFEQAQLFNKLGAAHFYNLRDQLRSGKSNDSMLFYILNRTCYNGMMRFSSKSGFNVPYCKNDDRLSLPLIAELGKVFLSLSGKIKANNWNFETLSFNDALVKHQNCDNTLRFCDPPYLGRDTQYLTSWDIKDEALLNSLVKDDTFILTTWHSEYTIDKTMTQANTIHYPNGTAAKGPIKKATNDAYLEFWSGFEFTTNDHQYRVGGCQKQVGIHEAIVFNK